MSENLGTIWVCGCCMLTAANGECCGDDEHGGDGCEPWGNLLDDCRVTMGMMRDEHGEWCDGDECDCESNTYSTSQCEGCGSWLHGGRYAFTLWAV